MASPAQLTSNIDLYIPLKYQDERNTMLQQGIPWYISWLEYEKQMVDKIQLPTLFWSIHIHPTGLIYVFYFFIFHLGVTNICKMIHQWNSLFF
jgi:lipid-A-disaccharide synthase-like uncharacterized protein